MTEVLFYHLERARLDAVLPGLLEKTMERGWKATVWCGTPAAAARIDELLWTYAEDSFLPHSAAPENAARQPIFITADRTAPNSAEVVFFVEGAEADPSGLDAFVRCVTIFDGADDAAVARARAFWKGVRDAGHDATYWRQSANGRWEKQA